MNAVFERVEKYKAIILDLDDTVYKEIEYLRRAYKYISKKIVESEINQILNEKAIFDFLIHTFIKEGRDNLFQKTVNRFKLEKFTLVHFLEFLRNVNIGENEIPIRPVIARLIYKYKSDKQFFILTNGNIIQQKNKIRALNIQGKEIINVYYASSLGKEFEKPNPYFILKILDDYKIDKDSIILIGDSETDELSARSAEIRYLDYIELIAEKY